MSGIIYFFSGRGNSFRVASDLSKKLDNMEIRYMGRSENAGIDKTVDCIGIISPVIDFGIPAYVEKFIKNLKVEGTKPYVFSIITFGGMPCASMLQMEKGIHKSGLRVNAEFMIKFGLEPYSESDWNTMMDDISAVIRSRSEMARERLQLKDKLLTALLNPMARMMIPGEDKKFGVYETCNGCGVCVRICPVGNIRIEDRKPVWGHRCEQCAACFAWCPSESIHGSNLAAKTRYRNPHVTLDQILRV